MKPSEEEPIIVRKINTYLKTKDNECFQIALDFKHKEKLYDCKFWPAGVEFARLRLGHDENLSNKVKFSARLFN